jgi:hypothetical protein
MEADSPDDAASAAPTPQAALGDIGQEVAPSSCLSASSADKAWGLGVTESSTTPGTTSGNLSAHTGQGLASFKEAMKNAMRDVVCRQHGGPRAYLNTTFDTAEKRKMFATTLLREFPMQDTHKYVSSLDIPAISKDKLGQHTPSIYHMASFSFHEDASTKMPPGEHLTLALVAEYLTDGFLSSGEPLLLSVPPTPMPNSFSDKWVTDGTFLVQGIGYVKGQARMLVLLAMMGLLIEDSVSGDTVKQVHETLYQSVRAIYAHKLVFADKEAEIFENFKLSQRGEIRRAPNVITWVFTLMELGKKYQLTDIGAVLRKWNNMASKSAQLLGGKSQSVKNIMELLPQGA